MSVEKESRAIIRGNLPAIEEAIRERQAFLPDLEVLYRAPGVLVLEACSNNVDWLSDWALDLGVAYPAIEVYVEWLVESEVAGTFGVRNQELVHRTEALFDLETGDVEFNIPYAMAPDSAWAREMSRLLQELAPGRPNVLLDAYGAPNRG